MGRAGIVYGSPFTAWECVETRFSTDLPGYSYQVYPEVLFQIRNQINS